MKKYIAVLAGILIPVTGMAQDLTKEITLEKDIVPIEREASRIDRLPQLRLPAVEMKRLKWSDRAVAAPVTATVATLAPAPYLSEIERPGERGYVYAGYFPTLQTMLSAGYRFVDDETTTAGAWLQYDGSQYKKSNIAGNKLQYRDYTGKLGMDMRHNFDGIGSLSANLTYAFSSFNYPTLEEKGFNQNMNNIDLGISWRSLPGTITYYASADYGFFKFGKPDEMASKSLTENYGDLKLGGAMKLGGNNLVGADLSLDMVSDNTAGFSGINKNAANLSVIPYFITSGDTYNIKLGVNIGRAFNRGSVTYIAPDVRLEWLLTPKFTLYGLLDGGARLNRVATIFASDHLVNPSQSYATTRKKIGAEAGFLIGPFAGASIRAWGSYATLTNQLMPEVIQGDFSELSGLYMGYYDFKSITYGIMLDYRYRDLAEGYVGYEGAPRDYDRGNALWSDRARHVLTAGVKVTPVKSLDISLSYTLRANRAIYICGEAPAGPFESGYSSIKLGNVSSLDLGAAYRVNTRLSVWLRGENLLGSDWQENYLLPCKGITGLVGLGYKF